MAAISDDFSVEEMIEALRSWLNSIMFFVSCRASSMD
jgi:hypothetical protein